MKTPTRLVVILISLFTVISAASARLTDSGFENGTFDGWIADPNWIITDNANTHYSNWQGRYWAWSGGGGESSTGILKSKPFVLDKDAVKLLMTGWNSAWGTGNPRKWNFVTLNLEDGTELDRVYAPNTTTFVTVYLDGSAHKGKRVYIEAVDDADQTTFSMIGIDSITTTDLPKFYKDPIPALPRINSDEFIKLEDAAVVVAVNKSDGSLSRVIDKKTGLELIMEPRLAQAFRFALMIPGREPWQTLEANWIKSRDQKLSSYRLDGKKLTLEWQGPLRNYLGAKFNAFVTEAIELKDGGILFNLSVNNSTTYPVGEVYFPIIGGIQGLGKTHRHLKTTELVRPAKDNGLATADIFRVFNNMSWLGDQGPEQFYSYPDTQPEPWAGFASAKLGRGVYIGAHDPANRKQVVRLELIPAGSGTPREDGNWPRPEELRGIPAGVEISFVEIANFAGRQTYNAAPVFLKFVDGAGKEMKAVYEAWKSAE